MPRELTPEETRELLNRKKPERIAPIPLPVPPAASPVLCPKCQRDWRAQELPFNVERMLCVLCVRDEDEKKAMVVGEQYLRARAEKIVPRADNPRRRINEKGQAFVDLVASVRAAGIVTPLLGRPHPTMEGCIELLAGHRRRLAGLAAGLEEFPVIVRDVDDRTAAEIMVFENLDRENLSPLEEAEGVELLLKYQHAPAEIAARMGKSVQWVARRRSLLGLIGEWQEWVLDRPSVSAGHLELIARCPAEMQREIFNDMDEDDVGAFFVDPGSLKALREWIGDRLMELKLAPWDRDNAVLLPKAGACSVCPKRSGCQPDLFGDPEDGEGDRCLDRMCWDDKRLAYLEARRAELKKENKGLVLVEGAGADWQDRNAVRSLGQVLPAYAFKECRQSDKAAVPALIVCGKGMGSLTWVNLGGIGGTRDSGKKEKAKGTAGAAGKQAEASLDPEASAALLKERREMLEKRRWALVCKKLQARLEESDLPPHPDYRTPEGMVALAWEQLTAYWEAVRKRVMQTLAVFNVGDIGEDHHRAIQGAAMLLTLTVQEVKLDANEEIPEPKSFEQLQKLAEAPAPAREGE